MTRSSRQRVLLTLTVLVSLGLAPLAGSSTPGELTLEHTCPEVVGVWCTTPTYDYTAWLTGETTETLVFETGFDPAPLHPWSVDRGHRVANGERILGPLDAENATLSLVELPNHTALHVVFDLILIGAWDGNDPTHGPDGFALFVEGDPPGFETTLARAQEPSPTQCYPLAAPCEPANPPETGAIAKDTLGFAEGDLTFRLDRVLAHTGPGLALVFDGRPLREGTDKEQWALDNVQVSTLTDTGLAPDCTVDGLPAPCTGTVSGEGPHTVVASDGSGDENGTRSLALGIDSVPPTCSAEPDLAPEPSGWFLAPVDLTLHANDATSGIAHHRVRLGNASPESVTGPLHLGTAGRHEGACEVIDHAGHRSETPFVVPLDLAQPTCGPEDAALVLPAPSHVNVSATDDASGIASLLAAVDGSEPETVTGPILLETEGAHMLACFVEDGAGRTNTTNWTVLLDAGAPLLTLSVDPVNATGLAGWYNTTANVTVNASDAGAGLAVVQLSLDGGLTWTNATTLTLADGEHHVVGRAIDLAGHNTTAMLHVAVDTTPPTVVVDGPLGRAPSGPLVLTWNFSEPVDPNATLTALARGEGWNATWSPNATTLRLEHPGLPGGDHDLVLGTAARDAHGVPLAAPHEHPLSRPTGGGGGPAPPRGAILPPPAPPAPPAPAPAAPSGGAGGSGGAPPDPPPDEPLEPAAEPPPPPPLSNPSLDVRHGGPTGGEVNETKVGGTLWLGAEGLDPETTLFVLVDHDGTEYVLTRAVDSVVWNTTDFANGYYTLELRRTDEHGNTQVVASREILVWNPRTDAVTALATVAVGVTMIGGLSALSAALLQSGVSLAEETAGAVAENAMHKRGRAVRLLGAITSVGPARAATIAVAGLALGFTIEQFDGWDPDAFVASLPFVGLAALIFSVSAYTAEYGLALASGATGRFRFLPAGLLTLAASSLFLREAFGYPGYIEEEDQTDHTAPSSRAVGVRAVGVLGALMAVVLVFMGLGAAWRFDVAEAGMAITIAALVTTALPFKPLPGHDIWRWNKGLALLLAVVGMAVFLLFELAILSPLEVLLAGLIGFSMFLFILWVLHVSHTALTQGREPVWPRDLLPRRVQAIPRIFRRR